MDVGDVSDGGDGGDGGNGGDGGDGGGTMALSTSSEGYVIWDLGYYRLGCRVSANQQSFLNR